MEDSWFSLILLYLSVMMVHHVTGTTLHNRASGLLSTSPDDSDIHPLYFETGFNVPLPSNLYRVFGTSVTYLKCFDLGYCYCSSSQISKTVTDDYPATANPAGTGMYTTGSSVCLLAPFVAPKFKPVYPDILDTCPTGYDLFGRCIRCPTGYSRFQDRCYKIVTGSLTFAAARAACETENADLVSLDTIAFYDFIAAGVNSIKYWVGANDFETEGAFVWNNGKPITYGWGDGEPNDGGLLGAEDCASLRGSDGTLNDFFCGQTVDGYICEKTDYTYYMEYSTLAYNIDKDKHVIERLVAESSRAIQINPNLPTLANIKAVLVTWNIIDNDDTTKDNKFQLAMLTDNTNTFVFYIYGDMLLEGISGNVQGYIRGGTGTLSGRVCNYLTDPADLDPVDDVLPYAELKDYTNIKCGNPGVYVFTTTAASDACAGTATDCATSYVAASAKPNCNVTGEPVDTCTEAFHCTRDGTTVTLTVSAKWYAHTNPYIQALRYATWVGTGSDTNPVMEQDFVPVAACGKQLATTSDNLVMTFGTADTADNRCGTVIVTGPPLVIKFATKIFEWDGTGTPFGPNQMFDRPGDLIIYGSCYPDETPLSVSQTPVFKDASEPTELPARSRSLEFKVVDQLDDVLAQELSAVQIGRKYFLRICFDRGSPYNENADPFGIHVTQCTVANTADFTGTAVYNFISGGCSVDASVGPMYLGQAFKVRSSGYAFGTTKNPWCQYTGVITAARWNKFLSGSLADKLYFRCIVDFCTILDGTTGTDEKFCHNSCVGGTRRKRNVENATTYPQEVVYTSVLLTEPEEKTMQGSCSLGATNFPVAIATIGALVTLIVVVSLIEALLFLKLMRVLNKKKTVNKK